MSYCVNCGVKLAPSEKVCPLCDTPVINPKARDEEAKSAYPDKVDTYRPLNVRFIVGLLWIGVAVVSVIVVLCDLLTARALSWSVFVIGGVAYAGAILTSISLKSKWASLLSLTCGTLLLLLLIAWRTGGMEWFAVLAAPLTVLYGAYVCFCFLIVSVRGVNGFRKWAVCFLFFALTLIGTEGAIDNFVTGKIDLFWSLYSAIPFAVIGAALLIISFNERLMNEIKKRSFL